MNELIYGTIGALVVGAIKWFFTQQKEEIKRVEDACNTRIKELEDSIKEKSYITDAKIDKIHEGHLNIYNDILGKFSNWEDRIKKMLSEMPVGAGEQGVYVNDYKKEILKSFNEFDKAVKRDLGAVKKDMDLINFHAKRTEDIINSLKLSNTDKESIKDALKMVVKVEAEKNQEIGELQTKLSKLFDVCRTLNHDFKSMEQKIVILHEMSKNKIRLKE